MPKTYFELQTRFADALAGRKTDAAAVQFEGDPRRVEERLALYRGNVLAARQKALSAAYPVTAKIVGDEFFQALTRAYMQTYPSLSGDLNEFGGELADFLRSFEGAAELPYLPEVAELEWQVHRAHYAADREPLDLAELMDIAPEQQSALQFILDPACALLYSPHPIERIWTIHQDDYEGEFSVDFDSGPHYVLVHRPHWRVQVRSIGAGDFALFDALSRGAHLGAALEAALDADENFDLGRALGEALQHKVFVACQIKGESR